MPFTNKVTTVIPKPVEPKVKAVGSSALSKGAANAMKRKHSDSSGKENSRANNPDGVSSHTLIISSQLKFSSFSPQDQRTYLKWRDEFRKNWRVNWRSR
jgi:hypothetical protein